MKRGDAVGGREREEEKRQGAGRCKVHRPLSPTQIDIRRRCGRREHCFRTLRIGGMATPSPQSVLRLWRLAATHGVRVTTIHRFPSILAFTHLFLFLSLCFSVLGEGW